MPQMFPMNWTFLSMFILLLYFTPEHFLNQNNSKESNNPTTHYLKSLKWQW